MNLDLHLSLPPDLNTYITLERGNRFAAAKTKKEWTERLAWEIKSQIKNKTATRVTSFILEWHHPNRRKDFDNVEFGVKFVKDAMMKAGFIENDGWNHFPPKTIHLHQVDKDHPGVIVSIEYDA